MEPTIDPQLVLAASQGVRERVIALVRDLDAEAAATVVPTCPEWTVTDLLCHLRGAEGDIASGRVEGAASDAWTASQVERHGGKDVATLCAEWAEGADRFDAVLLAIPEPINRQIVMDRTTHEHDLRLALGAPGARDDDAVRRRRRLQRHALVRIGSTFFLMGLRRSEPLLAEQIEALGLSDFELFRSLSGRRSLAQMTAAGLPAEALAARMATSPVPVPSYDVHEGPDLP